MISEEKSRRPVELSSIINVVQHDQSHHKMELKSVVHLGNNGTRKSSSNGVKGHDTRTSKTSKSVNEKPVLLLPFGHQVSGRASMLCYDETTILKPYVSRELYFYQSMPQDLKRLAPQFRGLVTVSFIEDSTTASILAYALPRTLVKPSSKSIIKLFAEEPKPHSKRCVKDFGKTHVIYPSNSSETNTSYSDDEDEDLFVEAGGDFIPIISKVRNNDDDDDVVSELSQGFDVTVCIKDKKPSGKENDDQNFSTTGLHNPWNSKVLDDAWLKLKFTDTDNPSNGKKKRFTLLENVVARYRRPCVLDLKIGTRVRENASPEKIARHVTAINLGARLSGMQIYHPKQEKFSYHNKYYGHNLTVSGFKSNLRHFFSRGTIPIKGSAKGNKADDNKSSIDRSLVKEAMKKLTQLRDAVELMQSHRFYSSSVLLLYEGDVEEEEEEEEEEQDPVELSSDEVVDAVSENSLEADEEVSHTTPASITVLSDQKGTPRSFSFSEFLQRLKQTHSKHQMKRAHENSSKHHDDSKKSSQKYMKGSVICKYEKSRRQSHENDDEKSHKTHHHHHCSRHHHDFEDAHESSFPSKSWPPRSKSASKSSSQKSRHHERARNQDESTKKHSCESPMEITSSDEKKSRKVTIEGGGADKNDHGDDEKHHHDDGKSHEDVRTSHRDVIDVRMIDFAHYCFHDNSMHPGPDGGFLFGLENLIRLLSEMLKL